MNKDKEIRPGDSVYFVSKFTPVPITGIVSEIYTDGILIRSMTGENEIMLPRKGPVKLYEKKGAYVRV